MMILQRAMEQDALYTATSQQHGPHVKSYSHDYQPKEPTWKLKQKSPIGDDTF